ncbi:TM2 domain-containing protein [Rhodococcus sp. B10]|uniref:NINE protein n=1 Tax=Rhodococcus sp. B10 TaxID=2695876 RepID=UPI00143082BD
MTEPEKNRDETTSGSRSDAERPSTPPEFGAPFDYDATAEASLSEPPATSEIGPVTGATGSGSGSGPGWDVHSGVGNGPGWGASPSYPPPSEPDAPGVNLDKPSATPSYDPNSYGTDYGTQPYGAPTYGAPNYGDPNHGGPVYGPPDPGYQQFAQPTSDAGYAPPPPPGYGPQGYTPQPYGGFQGGYGVDPSAPFGRHPMTGEPLSDKSKVTAGLLEILLGAFGAGRFYLNQPGIAIAQIAVTWLTCGIGGIWPLIDGIMMLTGSVRDQHGRPLRD